MKKKYREDLNRHISEKINEFTSLALAEGTPSLKLYYGIETVSCRRLLRMARMDMD